MAQRCGPQTGVYFLACQGFVKIGVSIDVARRYYSIKNANPMDVRPLGFIHVPTLAGAEERESGLHQLFAGLHHRGEWFRDEQPLQDYIAANATRWPLLTDWD